MEILPVAAVEYITNEKVAEKQKYKKPEVDSDFQSYLDIAVEEQREETMAEQKYNALKDLGDYLSKYGGSLDIKEIKYVKNPNTEEETAKIIYNNGYKKEINITDTSIKGIIRTIIEEA